MLPKTVAHLVIFILLLNGGDTLHLQGKYVDKEYRRTSRKSYPNKTHNMFAFKELGKLGVSSSF